MWAGGSGIACPKGKGKAKGKDKADAKVKDAADAKVKSAKVKEAKADRKAAKGDAKTKMTADKKEGADKIRAEKKKAEGKARGKAKGKPIGIEYGSDVKQYEVSNKVDSDIKDLLKKGNLSDWYEDLKSHNDTVGNITDTRSVKEMFNRSFGTEP